ncbi:MAG: hypothetical protein Tsb0020_30930 [Haliangiales bacterium]
MSRRDALAAGLVTSTVGFALLALGGAPRWAVCIAAALALISALVSWRPSTPTHAPTHTPNAHSPLSRLGAAVDGVTGAPMHSALVVAIAACVAQLVPLPAAITAWLSPARYRLARESSELYGDTLPDFVPLSYDPPETLVALAALVGALALIVAARRVAANPSGQRWLAVTVAGAGAAMSLCGLAHHALGLDRLFGVYLPEFASRGTLPGALPHALPRYLAPLLNENHFAGLLSATAPITLALAVAHRGRARLVWIALLGLTVVTSLLLASRGGSISLGAGLLSAGMLLVLLRRPSQGRAIPRSAVISAVVIAACGLVLAGALASDRMRAEWAQTSAAELVDDSSKFGVWQLSLALVDEHALTGVGRGGFEPAFTRLQARGTKSYSHVENEYLQAIIDWGLPLGLLILLLLARALWHAAGGWRRGPLEVGALAGLVALAVHAFSDFHLQLMGVAAVAVALFAIVSPARPSTPRAARESRPDGSAPTTSGWWRRGNAIKVGAAVGAVVIIALAASPLGMRASEHEAAMRALLQQADAADEQGTDAPALAAAIAYGRAVSRRHPADYLLPALTARGYFHARDPEAVRWVNRALALNPKHAELHVLAAHMLLAARRPEQALLEYRLALRYTLAPAPILRDLARRFPDPARAAQGLPVSVERLPVLTTWLRAIGRDDIGFAYARQVYQRAPDDPAVQRVTAELAARAGELDLAVKAGRPAYERSGSVADAVVLGRALAGLGRTDEAIALLEEALGQRRYQAGWELMQLYQLLAEAHLSRGDAVAARASLRAAIRLAPGRVDAATHASLYRRLADIEAGLGNTSGAAAARRQAAALGGAE